MMSFPNFKYVDIETYKDLKTIISSETIGLDFEFFQKKQRKNLSQPSSS